MNNVEQMFNAHKMKYIDMINYFNFDIKEQKTIYFFIDFDYILSKYLHMIEYNNGSEIPEECIHEFLIEFLNLISHYKSFFYNKCDSLSFFYITINRKKHENDKNVSKLITSIAKIITMIPRIFILYVNSNTEGFFIRYNLIRKIITIKGQTDNKLIFLDMSRNTNSELFYKLTKNYHLFKYEHYKVYLYGFTNFREEALSDVENIHINAVISLLTVYLTLNNIKISTKVKINDVIMKYVRDHPNDDFNALDTKLLIIQMFSSLHSLKHDLIKLENNLNSPTYGTMLEIIMTNWKHIIKDNSILRINELLHIPNNKRINIELLMNC